MFGMKLFQAACSWLLTGFDFQERGTRFGGSRWIRDGYEFRGLEGPSDA